MAIFGNRFYTHTYNCHVHKHYISQLWLASPDRRMWLADEC